tara:strand:+ start:1026 stop:1772 length:747 start_codon:yes stop_codon:yes gene_type:complete
MTKTTAIYKASDDAKVRQFKGHLNSTGHTAGAGCPEATEGKGGCHVPDDPDCYVYDVLRYPAVGPKLDANHEALKECKSPEDYADLINPIVESSLQQYHRRLKKAEGKERRRLLQRGHIFRHHWSGDVLSIEHAKGLLLVAVENPETSFWIYTRTWWAAGHMRGAVNLSVFLSTDAVNIEQMRATQLAMPELKLAHMTTKEMPASDTAIDCPVTVKKLASNGGCNICGICFNTDVDVNFHVNYKKEAV